MPLDPGCRMVAKFYASLDNCIDDPDVDFAERVSAFGREHPRRCRRCRRRAELALRLETARGEVAQLSEEMARRTLDALLIDEDEAP